MNKEHSKELKKIRKWIKALERGKEPWQFMGLGVFDKYQPLQSWENCPTGALMKIKHDRYEPCAAEQKELRQRGNDFTFMCNHKIWDVALNIAQKCETEALEFIKQKEKEEFKKVLEIAKKYE